MHESSAFTTFYSFGDAGRTTTQINGEFIFFQSLIDCLIRLKYNEEDKEDLIICLKQEYKDNKAELKRIDEFDKNYKSDNALWWYTCDSFLYRTLNTALRKQNIQMLYLYRSVLVDINRQLLQYQCKESVTVYRYQLMSKEEIKSLKKSVGRFISPNSFLSTSKKRQVADIYVAESDQLTQWQNVLFRIEASLEAGSTKPFAYIKNASQFPEEEEILFMLGSIFYVESINKDHDNKGWMIKMSLCNDDQNDLKLVLEDMKKENGIGETSLWTLGRLVWKMGKLDLAEQYYHRLLPELFVNNDPSLRNVYGELMVIASQQGHWNKSTRWREKLMKLNETLLPPVSANSGEKI